ncbi:hypothetical protein GCG54_00014613 [Colletotrichum gloeosporioides]|uniref:RING-type domain-containing protein n=1 Tax=Colletotrichum gloeosporioides TaxID=474922 RepID=A0A8H4C5B1_COLGL|nr:uncharacterized protein GCG54_00014613 [Colletotrichum gloeosporioides]KAF3797715.1 hypothetical protein GCG54_00014613 [Colletotrichum gloeosporioides]
MSPYVKVPVPRRRIYASVIPPASPRRSPRHRVTKPEYNIDRLFSKTTYSQSPPKAVKDTPLSKKEESQSLVKSGYTEPEHQSAPARDLTTINCACRKPNAEKPYIFTKCGHAACQSCLDNRGTCCGKVQNVQLNYQAGESSCVICREDSKHVWCVLICGHRSCKQCFGNISADPNLRSCPICRKSFQVGYIVAADSDQLH